MGWATGVMVYLVIWWIALFMVLPLGVRRAEKPGKGEERGAPEQPDLVRKAIITTILAAVLWIVFYVFYQMDVLSFRRLEGSCSQTAGPPSPKGNGGPMVRRPLPPKLVVGGLRRSPPQTRAAPKA